MPLNLAALEELLAEELRKQDEQKRASAAQASKPAWAALPKDEILQIPIALLEDHPSFAQGVPFRAPSEERIAQIAESIHRNGVLSPLLIRPLAGGRYQILAGHTRKRAAMKLRYDTLPCIVKKVDEAEAADILISDNLAQRLDGLLPSEKAFAYKMKLDTMKRQGARTDLTSSQFETKLENRRQENSSQFETHLTSSPLEPKLPILTCAHDEHKLSGSRTDLTCTPVGHKLDGTKSVALLASDSPDCKTQIQRYIRLTYLIPELLQMVDDQKLGLRIGVSLSYLTEQTQHILLEYLSAHPKAKLKIATADELRKLDEDPAQEITLDTLEELLEAQPQRAPRVLKLQLKPFRQYFPANAKPEEITLTIAKALDFYFSHTAE